jgi:hypothetical protein
MKPTVVTIKSSQPIQLVVEPIQMENPQFYKFQLVLISSHSIEMLRHISMFLEQVSQNATT